MKPLAIGLSSVARAGKDTFAKQLRHLIIIRSEGVSLIAFADALKEELDDEMLERFNISAFTQDSAEKAVIRPHLVARGKLRREETGGTHWIKQIEPRVKNWLSRGAHVIVTDVRYANEATWIHSLGGKVIYIERVLADGSFLGPANEEEAINDPQARAAADLVVTIPTFESNHLDKLTPIVHAAWSQLTASVEAPNAVLS